MRRVDWTATAVTVRDELAQLQKFKRRVRSQLRVRVVILEPRTDPRVELPAAFAIVALGCLDPV